MTIVSKVLNEEQLAEVNKILSSAEYSSGTQTAGEDALPVKCNEQADAKTSFEAAKLVMPLLLGNQKFQKTSFCKVLNDPLFARYSPGMYYGPHIDDPLMRCRNGYFRTDIQMTLFLNNPDEYEGGELCADDKSYKLPAGYLVMHPSDTLHYVNPVTDGTRHVMVTWCQSIIKDPVHREILIDLETSRNGESSDKISTVYGKLVRMWSNI